MLWEKGYVAEPPLEPLLRAHILWTLVLLGLAIPAALTWPKRRFFRVSAYALTGVGFAILALVFGRELYIADPSVWFDKQELIAPRLFYALAASTKVPAVPMILAGITLGLVLRRQRRSNSVVGPDALPLGSAASGGVAGSGDPPNFVPPESTGGGSPPSS